MEYKNGELTSAQLRTLQLIELEMLEEFDRVCNENDINYVVVGGTMLGAIRHKGFIPWDDDVDICMLREDYEKLKKLRDRLNPDICYFQDHTTDPYYRWGYGKIRRTGTKYIRVGQEHLKCQTGIFIDVFPLDDVPKSLFGQMFQNFYCYCCRKILWSEVGKKTCRGLKRYWFSLLSKIPTKVVFSLLDVYVKRSSNASDRLVRTLCMIPIGIYYYIHPLKSRYGMPKKWFTERARYDFESIQVWGTKDYDAVLTHWFGDYMTPPPEEKRVSNSPFSLIDFGNLE